MITILEALELADKGYYVVCKNGLLSHIGYEQRSNISADNESVEYSNKKYER